MKKSFLRNTLTLVCYALLAVFPWSCSQEDHPQPTSCDQVTALLTACTNGWKITSTKENGVVSPRVAPYALCTDNVVALTPTLLIKFSATHPDNPAVKQATEQCFCPLCGSFNGIWDCKTENGKTYIMYTRFIKFGTQKWTKEVKELTNSTMVLGFVQNGITVEETYTCQ